ncbi:MAG: HRDC domain-containing protein, partial [Acidobacteriaceae bacterium]
QQALETRLKDWRREAAKAAGLPTFFIVSDTVLRTIAQTTPDTIETLRTIRGLSPEKLTQFGPTILNLCRL